MADISISIVLASQPPALARRTISSIVLVGPPLPLFLARRAALLYRRKSLASQEGSASSGVFLLPTLLGLFLASLGFSFVAAHTLDIVRVVDMPGLLPEQMQRHYPGGADRRVEVKCRLHDY